MIRPCSTDAVRNSGRKESYIPPGLRKSGIPLATETPAPVRMAMERHSGFNISLARLAISTGVANPRIAGACGDQL